MLEQEHSLLQQKHSSVMATAEADKERLRELRLKLSQVEEELRRFIIDHAGYLEENRQLLIDNSRLTQVNPPLLYQQSHSHPLG